MVPVVFSISLRPGQSPATSTVLVLQPVLAAMWGWVIALVLIVVILAVKVRSLHSPGKFVGIPLLVSGALAILIALLGKASIIQMVTKSLLAATSDFARQEIENTLKHLTSLFFQPLLIQGIILAGAGILLVILMSMKKRKASG
jgi:hypothetical protein